MRGLIVVVIANSFHFCRIRSLFLRLRSLKLRPPYSTSIKSPFFPLSLIIRSAPEPKEVKPLAFTVGALRPVGLREYKEFESELLNKYRLEAI